MTPTQADGLTTFTTPVYASPLAMTPAVSPLEDLPDGVPLPSTAEKISATYGAGIGGQIQFLPYLETPTRDTPEIRASLRQMLKDPYVKAAWLTQCFSVARNKFQVHAYTEDDHDAAEQAEFITDGINRLFLGFAGLALSVLMPLGPDGVSIVEPVTEVEEMGRWRGKWVPSKAKSKDLETLYLFGDRYRNLESIRSVRTPELGLVDADEFLISRYAPMFDEAFGWAAFRSSYQAWWMLDTVRKLRAIHHEKRTSGTIVAKYRDKSNIPVLEAMLRRLKSSTWATVPTEVELQLLELTKASDTDYAKFEDDKIRDIVVGITFAELQMLTSPNERGDTEIHQSQSQLPIWYLTRVLEETINRQWIPRYINWNFTDVQGYPRVTIGGPDSKEVNGLIDLIQKAQAAGFDNLDRSYYAKALGLQLTDDPKKQLRPAGSQPPAGPMGAGLPGGGDGQDGPPDMSNGDEFDPEDLGLFDDEGDDSGAGFDDEDGQQFAEVSWTSFQGPMGGRGWKNSATGEVRYQAENPGGLGEGSGQNGNGSGATHNQDATTHNGSETSQNGAAATHNDSTAAHNGDGSDQTPAATGKPGVFGRVRNYANKVLDTKIGRLAQMAEHKLQIASHKTREIAVKAATARGATPEQTARLTKSLALADFIGGYVTGGVAGAIAGPLAAKTAMFLPSVSAVYLAYSAAKSPMATWKAALDVVASSSADPRHLVREGRAAWSGGKLHAEGAAPPWVAKLAELASDPDPETAEFKTAVFLAALTAGSDPDAALELAENPPKSATAAAVRKFAESGFTGTITDSIGRRRSYVNGKPVRSRQQPTGPKQRVKVTDSRGVDRYVHKRTDAGKPAARTEAEHVDHVAKVRETFAKPGGVKLEHLPELADSLSKMTAAEIGEVAKAIGAKGGKLKADRIRNLIEHAKGAAKSRGVPTRDNGTPAEPEAKHVYTVDPKSLNVDPERFQYKVSGIKAGGVTDELKGTGTYNPELGGTLLVWRDPANGKDYVINGHHRHELASRTGADAVNVRYIDAADAKEARAKGALANIAEGRGTATDAAKFLRDTGSSPQDLQRYGVSLSGKVAADAVALRDLSDTAFNRMVAGDLKESTAVLVAKNLKNPELQDQLFRKLEKREDDGKDWSAREIETAAKMMSMAGSVKTKETNLFGDWEDENSTFDQEVELRAHIGAALGKTVNDYTAVSNTGRAERVKEAGNVLSIEENRRRLEKAKLAADTFERESGLSGPVSDAIRVGAAELATAKTKREREDAKRKTAEAVRAIVDGVATQ